MQTVRETSAPAPVRAGSWASLAKAEIQPALAPHVASRNCRSLELLPFALYPVPGSLCPPSSSRAGREGGSLSRPCLASGTCQRTPGTSTVLELTAGWDGGCRLPWEAAPHPLSDLFFL